MVAFAAIEQKINSAVIKRLSNAQANFGGGLLVDGIFDAFPVDTYEVQSNNPVFQCNESEVSTVLRGASVVINSITYTVENKISNKAGWMLLELLA